MNPKDDMEEGEISDISDGEEPLGGYTPLERPVTAKAVLPQNGSNDGAGVDVADGAELEELKDVAGANFYDVSIPESISTKLSSFYYISEM